MSVLEPYYDDGQVTIYHGDAREILPEIDISDYNVAMTDPPYSSGGFQESGKSPGSIGTTTGARIDMDNLSTRGYRLLMRDVFRWVNQCDELFVFTDWRMWIECFDAVEAAGWRARNMIVWDKVNAGMGLPFRQQHELILYAKRTSAKITTGDTGNVIQCRRSGNKNHPTEKPIGLLESMLRVTEPDRAVLDPFMGSGSTLIAARNLGRKALGIEMSEAFCESAAKRLDQGVLDFGAVG